MAQGWECSSARENPPGEYGVGVGGRLEQQTQQEATGQKG